jgi:hypothetical protein
MAIKTFTTGEVLTASDTNTYLANSGLVYISTTTMAGATTQFVGAFTDEFTNYRAVFSYTVSSSSATYLRWLVGTTPQSGNMISQDMYIVYSAGTFNASGRADQYGTFIAAFPTYPSTVSVDFYSPKASTYSSYSSQVGTVGVSATDGRMAIFGGRNIATTQMTGFEITTASAITLAGTMTLYGYRKA